MPANFDKSIAVVGSRAMSAYGQKVAIDLTTQLVKAGYIIISGGMYGIDATAHQACIDAGGVTVAVLGYGLDAAPYPARIAPLLSKIVASGGCLISEFEPLTQAKPAHFLRRNRIVSGLSQGVLVIEATEKSGTLSTATHAIEQGRNVYAVPGSIYAPTSAGVKKLINMGAKLVTCVEDILEDYS